MKKKILCVLLASVAIAGCYHSPIGLPLPARSRFQSQWKHYVRLQPHKAIAVAGDMNGQYVAGYAFGYTTEGDAVEAALADCEARRADRRIEDPCRMFAVGDGGPASAGVTKAIVR